MRRKSYLDVDRVDRGDIEERFRAHDVNEVEDLSATIFAEEIKKRI